MRLRTFCSPTTPQDGIAAGFLYGGDDGGGCCGSLDGDQLLLQIGLDIVNALRYMSFLHPVLSRALYERTLELV